MTNVIDLPCVTTLDISPERVLNAAAKAELAYVVVIGEEADGTEYFASSKSNGPECLWALERAKFKLLQMVDSKED